MTDHQTPRIYNARYITQNPRFSARGYGEVFLHASGDDRGAHYLACRVAEMNIHLAGTGRHVVDAEAELTDGWHDIVEGRLVSEARPKPRLRMEDSDRIDVAPERN